MRSIARSALLGLALMAGLGNPSAFALPFANGSFDTPGDPFASWTAVAIGSASPGQTGTFVTFNSDTDSLSQSFTATAGQYFMTFYIQTTQTDIARALSVVLNGSPITGSPFTADLGPGWFKKTVEVSLLANNTLSFRGSGINSGQVGLDTISFEAVPGPLVGGGALSFLALGIGGLAVRLRRRFSAA